VKLAQITEGTETSRSSPGINDLDPIVHGLVAEAEAVAEAQRG
jgi:hypothetical protein